jgi:hypothetical protein
MAVIDALEVQAAVVEEIASPAETTYSLQHHGNVIVGDDLPASELADDRAVAADTFVIVPGA